jgi:2-hydroxycyclohexanecarboxyl-CoA dehydrogenase
MTEFTVRPLEQSGVIITGGTSGIGLAGARAFATAGVPRLVLIGRDAERGRAAVAAIKTEARIEFISADGNDPEQAERAVAQAQELAGPIDVLVNATAGPYLPRLLIDTPLADVPAIVAQQALAPLLMTRAVLPAMRSQRGGCIINIASDAAKVATPGEALIGAAMAAIVMFSRTVAMEAKRDGVRVNALTPSLVEGTGVSERLFQDEFSSRLFGKAGSRWPRYRPAPARRTAAMSSPGPRPSCPTGSTAM